MTLRFLRGQVGFMYDHGYDVHVMCAPGPGLEDFAASQPVTPHALDITRSVSPQTDLVSVARATQLMKRLRPDIVHAHTPKGGLVGMLAATAASVPARIYHLHGLPYLTASGWLRRVLWTTESISCGLADQVLAVSPSLAGAAREARFLGARSARVLGRGSANGVDTVLYDSARLDRFEVRARFGLPADAVVVTFVGRLVHDKGVEELVAAWRRIRSPERRLFVVGPFEDRDPVRPEVREALASDPQVVQVEFTEDMPEVYAASDLLVLPTYREGFPNAPLEAAAMGLPVVTTDAVGAVDSVVDGITGAIVPVGDVAALAEAMERYASSPTLRQAHGAAGRRRAAAEFAQHGLWQELFSEYVALSAG